ncbi:hypothetical protein RhiirA4_472641 [Rhizophagus irregularis]|uniref:Uncharacterized protein n=1 Tax=Rhizophagus irregularis TaxID=588596 RepID=A0A2I1H5B2_9GLOM|nr:hypothetical protein RhiirA4_472641 [Rhizophagus irregularis]
MVTLEGFKKLCGYLTFPGGTENEHIVSGLVIGGVGLKRKISTGKMRKKLDQASSSSQSATVESDTMKAFFGLKTDDYNELPTFVGGIKDTPEDNLVIGEFLRLHKTSLHRHP